MVFYCNITNNLNGAFEKSEIPGDGPFVQPLTEKEIVAVP
jgi:hypothetical protein